MKKRLSLLINRRALLKYIGVLGVGAMFFLPGRFAYGVEMINRIKARFMKPVKIPPDHERTVVNLPSEGPAISVETTLNSRCTSDYNENPEIFHWGIFNRNKKLSTSQINRIQGYINIPRLTNHRTEIRVNANVLSFVVDKGVSGIERDWLMVENGMQQQAVCLICAALGVGNVFKSFGKGGKDLSETDHATVRIKLDAMKPSYEGLYWTALPPDGIRPWLKGNLPEPDRIGTQSMIKTLSGLMSENNGSKQMSETLAGQLLWAARGRTPHLYKSRAWGMTIPTSRGEQDNTQIYLLGKDRLSRYVNWFEQRPTHLVKKINDINHDLLRKLRVFLPFKTCCIILAGEAHLEKVCWETGYQLLNIMLQSKALDLEYKTLLLDEGQKGLVTLTGVENPIASVCF